ncbi:phosphoenolpyruvate synthase, partial [Acidimicrobiaceae bacterium USS-CC1]|nr:phosphoenolpyruvate synthase [Acidiferrimicrobium australe]
MAYVAWFRDLGKSDTAVAGGKGANLGELARAGFPVPDGFVVTAEAYLTTMDASGVRAELRAAAAGGGGTNSLAATAKRLQDLVRTSPVPAAVGQAVEAAYRQLGTEVTVAVRSSATSEDTEGVSFAGMNQTFTNVRGAARVVERLQECWASMFGERVLAYRATRRITEEPAIAVVVQRMVHPAASGVMFSADPATGSRDTIVIEAAFGQGEVVVGGEVEPDTYTLVKSTLAVRDVRVGVKRRRIDAGPDGDRVVELGADQASRRVLGDDQLVALGRLAREVEDHYGEPQDIEFAIPEDGSVWLVQSRPITTLAAPGAGTGAPGPGGTGGGPATPL